MPELIYSRRTKSENRKSQHSTLGTARTWWVQVVLWLDHLCTGLLWARPVVLGLPLADERPEIRPPDSEVPSSTSRLVF